MEREKLESFAKKIIADRVGLLQKEIDLNETFSNLGLDSLDIVEIVMELEAEYQIDLLDSEVDSLKTPKEAIDLIEKHLNKK